jgi:hypothetical protein
MPARARWSLVVGISLIPAITLAVLPPEYYTKARAAASYHLRIAILSAKPPPPKVGSCAIEGEVVRILRNHPRYELRPGDRVTFTVNCLRKGVQTPLGGLWPKWEDVRNAKFLDGYFDPVGDPARGREGSPGSALSLVVVADQTSLIE